MRVNADGSDRGGDDGECALFSNLGSIGECRGRQVSGPRPCSRRSSQRHLEHAASSKSNAEWQVARGGVGNQQMMTRVPLLVLALVLCHSTASDKTVYVHLLDRSEERRVGKECRS